MAVVKARALGVRPREVRNLKFPLVFSLGGRRFSNFFSPLGFRVRLSFSIECYLRSHLRAVVSLLSNVHDLLNKKFSQEVQSFPKGGTPASPQQFLRLRFRDAFQGAEKEEGGRRRRKRKEKGESRRKKEKGEEKKEGVKKKERS